MERNKLRPSHYTLNPYSSPKVRSYEVAEEVTEKVTTAFSGSIQAGSRVIHIVGGGHGDAITVHLPEDEFGPYFSKWSARFCRSRLCRSDEIEPMVPIILRPGTTDRNPRRISELAFGPLLAKSEAVVASTLSKLIICAHRACSLHRPAALVGKAAGTTRLHAFDLRSKKIVVIIQSLNNFVESWLQAGDMVKLIPE